MLIFVSLLGAASIKFREKDVLAAARRLDPRLKEIYSLLTQATDDKNDPATLSPAQIKELKSEATRREANLIGVYQQIAVHFADLHDTPGRMARKGVICKQVKWSESRTFFYWRLLRRLSEFDLARKMAAFDGGEGTHVVSKSRRECLSLMKTWFEETVWGTDNATWDDDRVVISWFRNNQPGIDAKLAKLKEKVLGHRLKRLLTEALSDLPPSESSSEEEISGEVLSDILSHAIAATPEKLRSKFINALSAATKNLST